MGYAELIQKLETLPSDKQAEVFDFVDFLAVRCAQPLGTSESAAWTNNEFSELAMDHALRGIENDPVIYTKDDLREIWR